MIAPARVRHFRHPGLRVVAGPRIGPHPVHRLGADSREQLLGERGGEARRPLEQERAPAAVLILAHHVQVQAGHQTPGARRIAREPGVGSGELGDPQESHAAPRPPPAARLELLQHARGLERRRRARGVVVRARLRMAQVRDHQHLAWGGTGNARRDQRDRGLEAAARDLDLELERRARGEPGAQCFTLARAHHEAEAARLVTAPPERGVGHLVGILERSAHRRQLPAPIAQDAGGAPFHDRERVDALHGAAREHDSPPHLDAPVVRILGAVLERHDREPAARRGAAQHQRQPAGVVVAQPAGRRAVDKGGDRAAALPALGHQVTPESRHPVRGNALDLGLEAQAFQLANQPLRRRIVAGARLHAMEPGQRGDARQRAPPRRDRAHLLEQRPEAHAALATFRSRAPGPRRRAAHNASPSSSGSPYSTQRQTNGRWKSRPSGGVWSTP